MAWEWSCVLGDGRTFDALWLGTLLRDANRLQRLCLGRRIVRDLDALLQPELGALRACHGIGFTEGLVLYRPSTDRLWRNAKVAAASFINQPEAISAPISSPSSGVNFVGRCAACFGLVGGFAFGRTVCGISKFCPRGLRKRYVFSAP